MSPDRKLFINPSQFQPMALWGFSVIITTFFPKLALAVRPICFRHLSAEMITRSSRSWTPKTALILTPVQAVPFIICIPLPLISDLSRDRQLEFPLKRRILLPVRARYSTLTTSRFCSEESLSFLPTITLPTASLSQPIPHKFLERTFSLPKNPAKQTTPTIWGANRFGGPGPRQRMACCN